MNILFLTMSRIYNLEQRGIYPDLLSELVKNGHSVFVTAPAERRFNEKTSLKKFDGYSVLRVKVGNLQKTNVIEKGISTVLVETQFLQAIKKYYKGIKFDLVLYSTPPITFGNVINFIKKRDGAKTYLLLKDIFPQNAVDIKMFSKNNPIYTFFRLKEKKLYKQSDYIGCMSRANVKYLLNHNPYVNKDIVHIAPNSIKVSPREEVSAEAKREIREKYNIPLDKTVFIYGGNLGRPQGIPFLIECLKENETKEDRFFVVCGKGTEYKKIEEYVLNKKPKNVLLINGLPKEEYESFVKSCDVGLIFLDKRFTIPNFPSRLLSYMQNAMPVIACTDVNTDIGEVIKKGGFGWWCESREPRDFTALVDEALCADLKKMGDKARAFLEENYTVEALYKTIMENVNG